MTQVVVMTQVVGLCDSLAGNDSSGGALLALLPRTNLLLLVF